MNIQDRIKLAREGDEASYKYIIDNYSLLFCDNVVEYTKNIDDFKKAYELAPKVIDEFLESDNLSIYQFLRYNVVNIFDPRKLIKDAIKTNSNEDINYIVNYYVDSMYDVVKVYNNVLSDKKLIKFSKNRLKEIIKTSKGNIGVFNGKFYREKSYLQNDEFFFKRYILLMGIDDNIIDYFIKKYEEKENIDKEGQDLKIIIPTALNNLTDISESIKRLIIAEIHNTKQKEKTKSNDQYDRNVVLARNGNIDARLSLKEKNSDLKDNIFKDFQTNDNEEVLNKIINLKYGEYFNAYIKGNSTKKLRTYLNTRIREYLRKNKIDHVFLDDNYYDNLHLIEYLYKKVTNSDTNVIVRKELRELYTGIYYDYYATKNNSKKYFEEFLFEREKYFNEEFIDINNKFYKDDEENKIKNMKH